MNEKKLKRERRHKRTRAKITGTTLIPRLSVFRSNDRVFIQLIDDSSGKTLASVNKNEVKTTKGKNKTEVAFEMGKIIADKSKKINIEKIVFDKSGYKYHGRVKAVAEGARENGLKF